MLRRKPATPFVMLQARISLEAEQVRRELEERFDVSSAKLVELALFALARECKAEAHL
jgi:hypothetical protein